ncbi:hypothetical protein [Streptomyces sp. GbtcB6]|uniref:hypothetical protein n=1 Tax=Streptomyces sp. GbtcB6 TaxID=2824751 RepID=UPI001C2F648C|nr:hypothetical protein [Streptomyces sp. GbtcB6]
MFLDQPIAWTTAHGPAVLTAGVLVVLLASTAAYIAHRTSTTVLAASIGALVCTGFSADTSWRFADHRLHMETRERLWLFAAGEIVLIVCAVMARANKMATATNDQAGTPGVPGVMVWCIAGVQIVPAFTESGLLGGLVRVVFGPVMAALLWHLAMGLEIRVSRPDALSTGLPAQIGHELRERLLSHLGLAIRGRTAAQVTRDRATARAVRLASRRRLGWWGRAALKASVARSGAALDSDQRHRLLQLLAARRAASELRDITLPTPWTIAPVPEPYPSTPLGVTGAELRRMDPVDAVLQVHAAHPGAAAAELASLCTEYGVPVSEVQVQVALHAAPDRVQPAALGEVRVPAVPERPVLFSASPVDPATEDTAHLAVPDTVGYEYQAGDLYLDLTTEARVRPEHACAVPADMIRSARTRTVVHARVPDEVGPGTQAGGGSIADLRTRETWTEPPRTRRVLGAGGHALPAPEVRGPAVPEPTSGSGTADTEPVLDVPAELLERARRVDTNHRRLTGRPASIRVLKLELGIGQPKAGLVREALAASPAQPR